MWTRPQDTDRRDTEPPPPAHPGFRDVGTHRGHPSLGGNQEALAGSVGRRVGPSGSAGGPIPKAITQARTSNPHFCSIRVPPSYPRTRDTSHVRYSPGCVNQVARLRPCSTGAGPARCRGGAGASPGTRGTVLRQCQVEGQARRQWTVRSCSYPGQHLQGRGGGAHSLPAAPQDGRAGGWRLWGHRASPGASLADGNHLL